MNTRMGNRLREMRRAAGMSQMQIAEKLGVSYQQVQKYEKGTSSLSIQRLCHYARIFGVPVTAILELPDEELKAQARHSNLTEEEGKLLMLYRRLKGKRTRQGFMDILGEIVKLTEGK